MSEEQCTCPTCDGTDLRYSGNLDTDGSGTATINVQCEADGCGSRWYEIWKWSGFQMIEGEDNTGVVE